MYTFIACTLILVLGYFTYGKIIERIAGANENNQTPAYKINDGVDYIPISKSKAFLIHFLNIAGLGPVFGAIQGALFGPVAFIWIVLGTLFAGAVHDYFSGFLSLKLDGLSLPGVISNYLGDKTRKFLFVLIVLTCLLVTATFAMGSADLLYYFTDVHKFTLILIIFIYFLIATIFPIDKIIGKVYPLCGVLFLVMTFLILGGLFVSPTYFIPEITTQGLSFSNLPIFPFLFVTIACGAISGFHASQSPIISRCLKNEKEMRPVFFGSMVLEGFSALVWAAAAMAFFHGQPQLALLYNTIPSVGVSQMAYTLLGPIGLIITVIGVIICPITTGDTALRSARIIIADEFKINQNNYISRFKIALPLFLVALALTFVDFSLIWRYFVWLQLIIASLVLLAGTFYLYSKKRFYWVTFIPAMFCLLVGIAYILQASEGFRLGATISNVIAVIATLIISGIIMYKFKIKGENEVTTTNE